MDFYSKYRHQLTLRVLGYVIVLQAFVLGIGWMLYSQEMEPLVVSMGMVLCSLGGGLLFTHFITTTSSEPLKALWQAILHVAPHGESQHAPQIEKLHYGRELVSSLINHVYQMASVITDVEKTTSKKIQDMHANFLANSLPLPLLVLDKDDAIVYANETAIRYLALPIDEMEGKNIYTALDMSFSDDQTLHSWLQNVRQSSITGNMRWERVRIGLPGQQNGKQFDLAAHFNKENPMGYETLLIMFDHTEVYSQDDQAMSFVALSVHELRTPLTLLRGYIEVFDEELGPNLNAEMQGFMKKMDAAAQQLAAFVDNILNVAKIEDNQLTLQLKQEEWDDVLRTVVNDLRLRASVRGVTIKATVARNLPAVGVDRYSIYEVVANLLDNAIKYSRGTKEVHLSASLNANGLVETSVKDFGLGIDSSILPHIFDKFYRNHRNRAQIGGTGLGLYLSRAIVQAHGGQISVNSKVDEGSTFTFTVLPYTKLAEQGKTGNTNGITRGAHGWIKNHSLYRE
ncbi:PAS domain-containing protein [Candidatus Saccharibacteria bacterium]|nr:MAG: PAS domain-containing protein [Candidatus Saccharibacteria bacterium]